MKSIQDLKNKYKINEAKDIKEEPSFISLFVARLFEARQVTHVLHLQTKSYAEHKALDEFYNGILDLADEFIETYQGEYGIIKSYPVLSTQAGNSGDAIAYLEGFVTDLKKSHSNIKEEDSHLDNIIDEMTTLTYRTLYKLKNLK
jgi:hypothetical protein